MIHHDVRAVAYCMVGGPGLLTYGLLKLREERLISSIPISKVRSAAMGLIELNGSAQPRKAIKDPVAGLPCCWWRYVIQKYVREGKSSYWKDISEVACPELFYLDDGTGEVLVDPNGAELYIEETISSYPPPSMTGPSGGINPTSFMFAADNMRIRVQVLYPSDPVFIVGELAQRSDHIAERKQRFLARLQAAKNDPKQMAEADTNHDGMVDAGEWDAFRLKIEDQFLKEEAARAAAAPEHEDIVVRKPANQPFVISQKSEQELLKSFGWRALGGTLGGIALTGFGAWLAITQHWSPEITLLAALGGAVLGVALSTSKKSGGGKKWSWFIS